MTAGEATYRAAGVDTTAEERALDSALVHLNRTLQLRPSGLGRAVLPNGFFANVLDLGNGKLLHGSQTALVR